MIFFTALEIVDAFKMYYSLQLINVRFKKLEIFKLIIQRLKSLNIVVIDHNIRIQ